MRQLLIITIMLLLPLAAGCSKKKEKPKSSKIVEEMIGAGTIKRGEAMKKQLKEVEKSQQERKKELDEIE